MGVAAGRPDLAEAMAATEAVAQHFRATLEEGRDHAQVCLLVDGRRIAVEVATLPLWGPGTAAQFKPRLRFDKVVLRVIRRLREALSETVPDGSTVVFTMTAPIRQAAKTAAVLEARIRACLSGGCGEIDENIHGNLVRARLVSGASRQASKVVGFVHNPGVDPRLLIDMSQSLLQSVGAAADRSQPANECWLVLTAAGLVPPIETWRQVFAQLSIRADYANILMILARGRVENLEG